MLKAQEVAYILEQPEVAGMVAGDTLLDTAQEALRIADRVDVVRGMISCNRTVVRGARCMRLRRCHQRPTTASSDGMPIPRRRAAARTVIATRSL